MSDTRDENVGDVDREAISGEIASLGQRLGEQLNVTLDQRLEAMFGQISSMIQSASSGGGQQRKSGDGGGTSNRGDGDRPPNSSSQRPAAVDATGGGGNAEGFNLQGDTAAIGGGFGGYGFGDSSAGSEDGENSGGLFSGGGGLAGSINPSRISAPRFKGGPGGAETYPGWKADTLMQAGFAGLTEVFVGKDRLPNVKKSSSTLLSEGFSENAIKATFLAWSFLSSALILESDKAIIRRCNDPREALQ